MPPPRLATAFTRAADRLSAGAASTPAAADAPVTASALAVHAGIANTTFGAGAGASGGADVDGADVDGSNGALAAAALPAVVGIAADAVIAAAVAAAAAPRRLRHLDYIAVALASRVRGAAAARPAAVAGLAGHGVARVVCGVRHVRCLAFIRRDASVAAGARRVRFRAGGRRRRASRVLVRGRERRLRVGQRCSGLGRPV